MGLDFGILGFWTALLGAVGWIAFLLMEACWRALLSKWRAKRAGELRCGETTVQLVSGSLLYDQMREAGLPVKGGCRKGLCGRCTVRVLEGEVQSLDPKALVGEGVILSCLSCPSGSVHVELSVPPPPRKRVSTPQKTA